MLNLAGYVSAWTQNTLLGPRYQLKANSKVKQSKKLSVAIAKVTKSVALTLIFCMLSQWIFCCETSCIYMPLIQAYKCFTGVTDFSALLAYQFTMIC